ncbi:hypothetical protein FA95DRAFT_551177 [Auriscalpium vulgare]|uniref:Uncharacterized protein n=1 Tax=Auriscalpium vulgare TaxID=40419 RepID=A0ACB8S2D5_9AGAM|nr:hypothetical protein FA95DRAFT_551177 [Auriscalpium vulgare]
MERTCDVCVHPNSSVRRNGWQNSDHLQSACRLQSSSLWATVSTGRDAPNAEPSQVVRCSAEPHTTFLNGVTSPLCAYSLRQLERHEMLRARYSPRWPGRSGRRARYRTPCRICLHAEPACQTEKRTRSSESADTPRDGSEQLTGCVPECVLDPPSIVRMNAGLIVDSRASK